MQKELVKLYKQYHQELDDELDAIENKGVGDYMNSVGSFEEFMEWLEKKN